MEKGNTSPVEKPPVGSLKSIRLITRDSDTGEIIPCRVIIADTLGQYWGIKGRINSKRIFFHTPGDTLVSLYPGSFKATISRGLEYNPVRNKLFTVPESYNSGSLTVEIPIERWIHMKELG